jgi:periplasmic protein TonB
MSYASVKQTADPKGLGVAVAVNALVLGALIFSPITVEQFKPKPPITVINVKTKTPPPPDVIEPEIDQKDPMPLPPIFTPAPPIIRPIDKPFIRTGDKPIEGTPLVDGKGDGLGGKPGPIPDKPIEQAKPDPIPDPPVPVLTKAMRDPAFAKGFQPEYPESLIAREIEGSVKIKILIGADGRVRQAIIMQASEAAFGTATAKHALKAWRFIPAKRDGKAIEDWMVMTVKFTLQS